jgi:hypothetical protein
MGCVPIPVVVVVVMIITAFVARVAATQGKYHRTKKENDAQYIFYCVLHKKWFLKYIVLKILPDAKHG